MKNLLLFTGIKDFALNDLQHMQQAYTEALASLSKALINVSGIVILDGCGITVAGQNYTIAAGSIYYNGEIYQVDANALNSATTPNWAIDTSYSAADPVPYKDGNTHNTYQDNKMKLVSGAGIAAYDATRNVNWVLWNKLSEVGDVVMKAVDVNSFDNTGLGKQYTRWEGWAMMNGANGTIDMGGFFPVGQKTGGDYNAVGGTGGVESVTLTAAQSGLRGHKHAYNTKNTTAPQTGSTTQCWTGDASADTGDIKSVDGQVGRDGAQDALQSHENRPPFKVLRFLQKIA